MQQARFQTAYGTVPILGACFHKPGPKRSQVPAEILLILKITHSPLQEVDTIDVLEYGPLLNEFV